MARSQEIKGVTIVLEDGTEFTIPSGVSIAVLGVGNMWVANPLYIYQDDPRLVSVEIEKDESMYPYQSIGEAQNAGDKFTLPATDQGTTGIRSVGILRK